MSPKACSTGSHPRDVSPSSLSSSSSLRSSPTASPSLRTRGVPLRIDATNGQPPSPEDSSKDKSRMLGQDYLPHRLSLAFQRLRQSEWPQKVQNAAVQFRMKKIYILALRFRKILIPILFFFAIQFSYTFHILYSRYFGVHPIQGGRIGAKIDWISTQFVIDKTFRRRRRELKNLGVDLPRERTTPSQLLQMNTNAALREYLVRREKRSRKLIELESAAEEYQRGCLKTHADGVIPSLLRHKPEADFNQKRGIPNVIFSLDDPSWLSRRPININSYQTLTFTEEEMRELIEDNYQPMLLTFDSLSTLEERARLWAVCALYFYGGIFWGNRKRQQIQDFLVGRRSELFQALNSTTCTTPVGVAIFDKVRKANNENDFDLDVVMLAATPRHPHLRCVMNQLENSRSLDASQILSTLFFSNSFSSSQTYRKLQGSQTELGHNWESLTTRCPYGHAHTSQECCKSVDLEVVKSKLATEDLLVADPHSHIYVKVLQSKEQGSKHQENRHVEEAEPLRVSIREREGTEGPIKNKKISLESQLQETGAEPGWLCTRCLKTPLFGTLETCSSVCPSGYEELLCQTPDDPEKSEIVVELTIDHIESELEMKKRIPRIIHQTWFEKLSHDRYPQLVRLQNSWRNSGWEYRFYTDETARKYILQNFPSRFVDAFDALIPGAYKADLFRYLVLLKDGGIYADIDIMLDTTLDSFITPSLSFFAARDLVGEFADEAFCLWNGFIGAAPGHPFMRLAVERVVNLILERADLYDMERDVCRRVGRSMENWKVRLEPLLLSSGPCALGIAVNDALNRSSLSKFDIGWVTYDGDNHMDRDHGDALILVGDKYDLGAFRISDPERNLIVASTDLAGVDKAAREISNPTRGEQLRRSLRKPPKPHYSESARSGYVWGAHNVYKDDYVNNEVIKFDVSYNDK